MAAVTARAGYMMGENVDRAWSPEHARAWEGFLELSRQHEAEGEGDAPRYLTGSDTEVQPSGDRKSAV